MHLDIPFYPSFPTPGHPEGIHCEEMSIKMILGYFLPTQNFSLEDLERITGKEPEKASWEMPFSIWLADHGFEVKHISLFDYAAFERDGSGYIRRLHGGEVADWQLKNSNVKAAQAAVHEYLQKVTVIPKMPTTADIRAAMSEGFLVRAAVDLGFLNELDHYAPHSVVVTGYDDAISFHDPGPPANRDRKVSQEVFQEAMDKFGGEMDLIKKR